MIVFAKDVNINGEHPEKFLQPVPSAKAGLGMLNQTKVKNP